MTTPSNKVELVIGAKAYSGWQKISIERSLETIAGAFDLTVSERWAGQQAMKAIAPQDRGRVTIGGETVITGWVDTVEPDYDATSHQVTVRGRDAAGDLVDCSILAGVTQLPSGPALGMIESICAPFGIKVTADVPGANTVILNTAVQLSETAFATIQRIASQAGFLVVSDGQGGIRLTNPGTAGGRAPVILGKNILRAHGTYSTLKQFSTYYVAAQTVALDLQDPLATAVMTGKATDPNITRYRPFVTIGDLSPNGVEYLQQYAQWLATVNLGRAWRAQVTLQGWRDDGGVLWAPNTLVRLQDEFLAVDQVLLVAGVKFMLDEEEGTRSELTLTRKEAFQPEPVPLIPSMQNVGAAS
jgi:prophage tail gpP-like protein